MAFRRDPEDFIGRLRDLEDAVRALQRGPQGQLSISGPIRLGDVLISVQVDEFGVHTLEAVLATDDAAVPVVLATLS